MDWIAQIMQFVALPSILRALVFGLLSGVMLTQWIKFQLPDWLSDATHARTVRVLSSLLTCLTVGALWPYPRHLGEMLALALGDGLATPFVYWLAVKALYHFLPWTEDVISARPSSKGDGA